MWVWQVRIPRYPRNPPQSTPPAVYEDWGRDLSLVKSIIRRIHTPSSAYSGIKSLLNMPKKRTELCQRLRWPR